MRRLSDLPTILFATSSKPQVQLTGPIKKGSYAGYMLVLTTLFALLGCRNDQNPQRIRIAVAANMREPLEEIAGKYAAAGGLPPQLISGSSGKLVAQIREGAPYDILVSADTTYPNTLYRERLISKPPKIYAQGQLILWSMNPEIPADLKRLQDPDFGPIAIANPRMAPYGRAALEVLKGLDSGRVNQRELVTGENISQVNQFIASQSVVAGFTALSTVRSPRLSEKGSHILVGQELYTPIAQSACLLENSKEVREEAEKFFAYLFSKDAREILEEYGYVVPDQMPYP
ncbi:molybdate transport system substrate-binding protein [Robiginitalea myxolifaciens]|uniref:Molybdate transport system substrate-binding protein n=1 Tax=Robiginitalea myxolifaciens TaxID=400055 RepID=A0A1I6FNE0_9FLAO|nr:molybdate ABC transporter substrate-binding protein [Robiginitalea myxolifaciens]SFR31473.1 molybdate transport system substrate-binding protein [Robiginitalea myxolifaciens]